MSTLSAQCDRLRHLAHGVERIKNDNADWLWRDAAVLLEASIEMTGKVKS